MANSRFGYVRQSELDDRLLPQTYAVLRLDGKGFTKFADFISAQRDLNFVNRANEIRLIKRWISKGDLKSTDMLKQKYLC